MKNPNQNNKKRRFRLSLFTALTLVVIIGVCLGFWPGAKKSLFDVNVQTTLYAETPAGSEPRLDPSRYFSGEEYDLTQFTFDLEGCDFNTAGVYRIPVFYEGEKTNCVVELTVTGAFTDAPSVRQENEDTKLQDRGTQEISQPDPTAVH